MMFQDALAGEKGEPKSVVDIKGADLLGTKIRPPFGLVPEVYVLPMEGVLETKVGRALCQESSAHVYRVLV